MADGSCALPRAQRRRARPPTGNIRFPPAFTAQLYVLSTEGHDLVITVGAPTEKWDEAVALVAPVLASLHPSPAG